MYIKRLVNLDIDHLDRSIFIFGPRQTGKSAFLRHQGPRDAYQVNLLDTKVRREFEARPWLLRERLKVLVPVPSLVVIDEIQLVPELLNEVHLLIEESGITFILTGSSARKLRHAGVNLLGGRADELYFHPLSAMEIGLEQFDLDRACKFGLLPPAYFSKTPQRFLKAYGSQYLEQEIRLEGLVRSLPAFSRFLETAALRSGSQLNLESIAQDSGVARSTVAEYLRILYDTFIAVEIEPWGKSSKRKPVKTSKMYFFDFGVARYMAGLPAVEPKTKDYGEALEHLVLHELKTWLDFHLDDRQITFWRTITGIEVDFVIDSSTGIEVKAKQHISDQDLKGLRALSEEGVTKLYLISLESESRTHQGIEILTFKDFVVKLWKGQVLT